MGIKKVVVIGAGTMGNGIAQVVAQAGYQVGLVDVAQSALDRAIAGIGQSLDRMVKKGVFTSERKAEILQNIKTSTTYEPVSEADLVIEVVPEVLDLKVKIFKELDEKAPSHCILASNTSSLPITAIAAATKRPEKVIGMHFMNPVPVMKGVELIKARQTAQEIVDISVNFVKSIEKIPVVAVDYAGFITSRILNAYLNEAAYTVMDGNNPKDVDDAMVHCTNMPLGPCALIDLVGIDVIVYVLGILEDEFGPKFKPAPLLKQMVRAGHLGKKSGRGFYEY
jgi:3-hydroxybutyryl-CoA dehydrogenase